MPGRSGFSTLGGWGTGGTTSTGLPNTLTVNTRVAGTPEYRAGQSIEFTEGFQSQVGDEYTAYTTIEQTGSSGGTVNGVDGVESLYRYGFNGKENDNEVKGEGSQQDYGMRMYDPRLGRFLSVDPLMKNYAYYAPYQFAGNRPILAIDLDGLEPCDNPWAHSRGITNHQCYIPWQGWKKEVGQQFIAAAPLLGGIAYGSLAGGGTLFGTTTNLGIYLYTKYPIVAAVGAFSVGLVDESPPGTIDLPGPFDEAGKSLKYAFLRFIAPENKYVERFIFNNNRLRYLFDNLSYKGLSDEALENEAKVLGQTVEKLNENIARSKQNADILSSWGVHNDKKGYEWLANAFETGLNGKEIPGSRRTAKDGSISLLREVNVVNKETKETIGTMRIGYVYRNGDLNSTPEISTVIPIPGKKEK